MILYITHFIRVAIISCLPFIHAEWQIYVLVFLLNIFNAFFTPTYRAVIPQIIEGKYFREAVGLSTATFQLLGDMIGPLLMGVISQALGLQWGFVICAIIGFIALLITIFVGQKTISN